MALRSADEWSQQICKALANIDPQISTEIGDPIRKVIDATASVAAASDFNHESSMSFFDLDSKTGTDLDALASWLGFGRRDGLASICEVRFYVDEPATASIEIPSGTQVTDGKVIFRTTNACAIEQFATECFCSVQCDAPGKIGNVNAFTINHVINSYFSNGLKVENRYDARNGIDVETDAELRKRIRHTFLRNVAGTEDAYKGIAENVNSTRRVNVVGPIERWEEQLEVINLPESLGGGWGFQSMIPCSKYTWPRQTYLVREPDTPKEKQYVEGVDYTVDTSHGKPVVRIINSAGELNLNDKSGSQLDAIGKSLDLPRFAGEPATGSVAFGFDVAKGSTYTIRKGSRVQDKQGNIYITQADAIIYSQSFGSTAVDVKSQDNKPCNVTSGEQMTLLDRSGFKCECSDAIAGGKLKWDDAEYRKAIIDEFSRRMDISLGDFLFFKHEYCPIDSRNDPAANPPMTNKVDVFIDGKDSQQIRECTQIKLHTLNNAPNSKWYCGNFHYEDGSEPQPGTKIQVLGYSPVILLPRTLNINGTQYTKFSLVKNNDLTFGSTREVDAIAFLPGSPIPNDGSFLEIYYNYNRAVMVTDQLLDTNRQITTDTLAHECEKVGLIINAVVQNVVGASDEALQADVNALLDAWCGSLDFGQWIQFSDLEHIIHTSRYVDAVRIATKEDVGKIITIGPDKGKAIKDGVELVQKFRKTLPKYQHTDFRLRESMIPYIHQLNIIREASNTY